MGYKIDDIEGIGPAFKAKLAEAGITNADQYLEKAKSAAGRTALADETGISKKLILTWANRCDLMRLKGVGGQFAELMEAAGVDTVKELRRRNAANLTAKMNEVNAEKNLTKGQVSETQVQGWVAQANELEPMITH